MLACSTSWRNGRRCLTLPSMVSDQLRNAVADNFVSEQPVQLSDHVFLADRLLDRTTRLWRSGCDAAQAGNCRGLKVVIPDLLAYASTSAVMNAGPVSPVVLGAETMVRSTRGWPCTGTGPPVPSRPLRRALEADAGRHRGYAFGSRHVAVSSRFCSSASASRRIARPV